MIKTPRYRSKNPDEEFYVPVPVSPAGALDPTSQAARLLAAFLAGRCPPSQNDCRFCVSVRS
jgi:hypothetical protein